MSHRLLAACLVLPVLVISSNGASAQRKSKLKSPVPGADHATRFAAIQARDGEWAQFTGSDGRTTGSATTSGGSTYFRDNSGSIVGRAERSGDWITFYDASGNRTGMATTSSSGWTTYRDASGRTSETWSTSSIGTSFRDSSGRLVGGATSQGDRYTSFHDERGRAGGLDVSFRNSEPPNKPWYER